MVQVSEHLEIEEKREKRRRMKKLEEIVESKSSKSTKQASDENQLSEIASETHSAEGIVLDYQNQITSNIF